MKELYSHEIPWYLKIFGVWRVNRDSFDTKWGYFAPTFGFEFIINRGGYFSQYFSITFCFIWGKFNVKLPFRTKLSEGCSMPKYGFQFYEDTFWIHKGGKYDESIGQCTGNDTTISWYLPFLHWIHRSHEVQRKNGQWVQYIAEWDSTNKGKSDHRYVEQHPFTYVVESIGTVQNCTATVYKERRTWTRKWFPFLKMTHTCINVSFDKEIGKRSGSWKGGVMGTSIEIKPRETMKQALDRLAERDM